MKYWEEQLEFAKQIITHAVKEGVADFAITYDHFGPSRGPLKTTLTVTITKKDVDIS